LQVAALLRAGQEPETWYGKSGTPDQGLVPPRPSAGGSKPGKETPYAHVGGPMATTSAGVFRPVALACGNNSPKQLQFIWLLRI